MSEWINGQNLPLTCHYVTYSQFVSTTPDFTSYPQRLVWITLKPSVKRVVWHQTRHQNMHSAGNQCCFAALTLTDPFSLVLSWRRTLDGGFEKHRIVFQRRERTRRSHHGPDGIERGLSDSPREIRPKWNVEWINKYMNKSLWTVFLHKYCNSLSIIASLFVFSVPKSVFHHAPWRCHHSTIAMSNQWLQGLV